jgi:DnaJ family protein C protein 9
VKRTVLKRLFYNVPQGATEKFQTLQRVYEVLSDEEKRRVYDQTGSLEDSV